MFPAIFLSHGAPTLPLVEAPARDFLRGLGESLGKPRAIIVASAHWETSVPTFSSGARNTTIHDFYGFPRALYEMHYDPPGAPEIAEQASDLLAAAGLASKLDATRGLDHGAWVPLLLMFPAADIPVLQVSIQPHLGPAHHLQLGRALAPLREADVLIIGSGSYTHDLSRFRGAQIDAPRCHRVRRLVRSGDFPAAHGRFADISAARPACRRATPDRGTSVAAVRRDRRRGRHAHAGAAARLGDAFRAPDGFIRVSLTLARLIGGQSLRQARCGCNAVRKIAVSSDDRTTCHPAIALRAVAIPDRASFKAIEFSCKN
jgi:4,5-DOPA dioxygenase extradiol